MKQTVWLKPLFSWRAAIASEYGPASPVTRHVLLTLGLHMSDKGDSCFPSIKLLCEETALSNRTVITHLQEAELAGWIKRSDRRKQDGQDWKGKEYRAAIPQSVKAAIRAASLKAEEDVDNPVGNVEKGSEGGSLPSGEVVNVTTKVVNLTTEGGEGGSHEDVINSTENSGGSRVPPNPRHPISKRPAKTGLPADFKPSERVNAWAAGRGYPPTYVGECLEAFVSHVRARGDRYVDWDEALMTWIRREPKFSRKDAPRLPATGPAAAQRSVASYHWDAGNPRETVSLGAGHITTGGDVRAAAARIWAHHRDRLPATVSHISVIVDDATQRFSVAELLPLIDQSQPPHEGARA